MDKVEEEKRSYEVKEKERVEVEEEERRARRNEGATGRLMRRIDVQQRNRCFLDGVPEPDELVTNMLVSDILFK